MEELFRFIMTRPAEQADEEQVAIPVTPSREYHGRLRAAQRDGGAAAVVRTAAAFSESRSGPQGVADLKHGRAMLALAAVLAGKENAGLGDLDAAVSTHAGSSAAALVVDPGYLSDRHALGDSIVTASILGREEPVPLAEAARILRSLALVERISAADSSLEGGSGLSDAYTRALLLPPDIFPLRKRAAREDAAQPSGGTKPNRAELIRRRDELLSTYNVLTRVSPDHLAIAKAREGEAARGPVSPRMVLPPPEEGAGADERFRLRLELLDLQRLIPGVNRGSEPARTPLVLEAKAVERLDRRDRRVLADRGLDLTRTDLPVAVERLSVELAEIEGQIGELDTSQPITMLKLGGAYVPAAGLGLSPHVPASPQPVPQQVPNTQGSVAPAGIGDLLVVRQFLKRYEARELAHVENVLKGEFKERMHRRARTTEETITVETEVKKEEERDLQTTERFELKTEVSETLKQDQSLKVGLSVSGSYGPMVEFKATTDFAMNQAKEESSKVATSFSKEVTERASSKITERRREERILKTIEVFEEKNTHGIDNKLGPDHVVGQYQWIDKVYEAQVFNYGKRLLFDLMLPEPAAFLLHAVAGQPKAGAELVKPIPFTLTPADINEWNYPTYVKRYEVVGVEPPPQPYFTVSKVMDGEADKDHGTTTKSLEAPIPDGYQAISGNVVQTFTLWENNAAIDVVVGKNGRRFDKDSSWAWNFTMSNEVASVPLTLKTFRIDVFAVAIEIECQRTQRKLDDWKLKTHGAILQGYLKLLRDYEDKLAAAEVQAGIQIQGRNPLENERLIRTEVKKGAISIFTEQHYDLFDAIAIGPQGYPQPNLSEAQAEGRYIRFFEQAFEWEQMMFFFYPYFWGRKPNWLNRAMLQDVDPMFAEFIKAGAARVVVSVRPGFEQAVAHFLDTGQVWNGGDLPPISSPLYVSIIEEIRERDKAPGEEVAQGDPWDVRLPTTLVRIRSDTSLPSWQKNAQGEWVPV